MSLRTVCHCPYVRPIILFYIGILMSMSMSVKIVADEDTEVSNGTDRRSKYATD